MEIMILFFVLVEFYLSCNGIFTFHSMIKLFIICTIITSTNSGVSFENNNNNQLIRHEYQFTTI